MKHIFFRIYAGTVLAVTLALSIASVMVYNQYQESALSEIKQVARGTVKLIIREIDGLKVLEQEQWIQQRRSDFTYPISLVTWHQNLFGETKNQDLLQGQIIANHDWFKGITEIYAHVPKSENLIKIGPISQRTGDYQHSIIIAIIIALSVIGFAVFFLVHPIEVRLKGLENNAKRFAQGDLHIRATISRMDTVGNLETAFNYMADRIVSLIRAQQELTNAVSHELRTPIARLRFGLEMVSLATTHDEQEERLSGMDKDLGDLDHLIDELLMYARLGAAGPKIKFEPVNMQEMLEKVCTNLIEINPDIQYEWSVSDEAPAHVLAEAHYLQRAIHNLVSNASRYANRVVRCRFYTDEDNCYVMVDDDGPGIPEEERARVFSPFTRLDDSRTRATGGYGLGLAIVRRIVRWHKGTIWVDGCDLGGARFAFSWPRRLT